MGCANFRGPSALGQVQRSAALPGCGSRAAAAMAQAARMARANRMLRALKRSRAEKPECFNSLQASFPGFETGRVGGGFLDQFCASERNLRDTCIWAACTPSALPSLPDPLPAPINPRRPAMASAEGSAPAPAPARGAPAAPSPGQLPSLWVGGEPPSTFWVPPPLFCVNPSACADLQICLPM